MSLAPFEPGGVGVCKFPLTRGAAFAEALREAARLEELRQQRSVEIRSSLRILDREEPAATDPFKDFKWMLSHLGPCAKKRGKSGIVYFIEAEGAGMVKIGFSDSSAASRLKSIQTGCPYKLRIITQIPGGIKEERELHKRFNELRLQGEWFRLDGALKEFIANAERRAELP